jgi:Tfp pilus assembly protein PilV
VSDRSVYGRSGISMVEVLLAVALLASAGLCLLTLVSSGSQTGARAAETQMATQIAARVMDRFAGLGYGLLMRNIEKNGA